jgi:hypothetical protein
MSPTVIARVNVFGKNEPSILTFTNQHGREIGDHPQDYEPSGNDDDSVAKLILDVIPGLDPTPEDDAELPGVDMDFDAKPTGVELDSDYVSQELLRLMASGNKIQARRLLRDQASSHPLHQQLRHMLHHPRRGCRHGMPGIGSNLRSMFPA